MSYASEQALTEAFGERQLLQVADRDGDGVLDAAVITRALAQTDAEIDGYVGGRYELPLASTPPLLAALAVDIAFYRCHPAAVPEDVLQRYRDARRTLQDIAIGKVVLDVAGDEPDQAGGGQVARAGPGRTFSRCTLLDL